MSYVSVVIVLDLALGLVDLSVGSVSAVLDLDLESWSRLVLDLDLALVAYI